MTSVAANSSLRLSLTGSLPTDQAAVGGWFRQPNGWVESSTGYTLFNIRTADGVVDTYAYDIIGNSGIWQYSSQGSTDKLVSGQVTQWVYVAFVWVAPSVTVFYGFENSGALSYVTTTLTGSALTELRIFAFDGTGDDQATTTQARCVRMWDVARNSTQLLAESRRSTPVITSGLVGDWPLETAETATYATVGPSLTAVGTGVTVDDQPSFPDDPVGGAVSDPGGFGFVW